LVVFSLFFDLSVGLLTVCGVQLLLLNFTGRRDLSQGTDHKQSLPSNVWGRSGVTLQILCQAPELG